MALLAGIVAVAAGAAAVSAFFFCWDRGVRRYGRRADVLAISLVLALFALVALVIVSTPPY